MVDGRPRLSVDLIWGDRDREDLMEGEEIEVDLRVRNEGKESLEGFQLVLNEPGILRLRDNGGELRTC